MTVSNELSRISYAGNGGTTVFAFPYRFLENADLVVILRVNATGAETTKILTTDYTVLGAGDDAGGTVTMLVAPAVGETLTIFRDPEAVQELDLADQDSLPAEAVEESLDRGTMVSQRLIDLLTRSVRLSEGFAGTFDPTLPALLTGNRLLGINAPGTMIELVSQAALGGVTLPGTPGLAIYTGSSAFISRTLTPGSGIAVTDGDGQAGNPTIALISDSSELILSTQVFS